MTKCLPHYQGAIIGAAIGDALGFIIEKKPIDVVENFIATFKESQTYNPSARVYLESYDFGQYSDDTQFSKLLILSLIKNQGLNPQDYFTDLLAGFERKELIGLGKNTRSIFKAALNKEELKPLIKNDSNGSLMRTYPIAMFFNTEEEILKAAKAHSILTHNTEEAIETCQVLSLTMHHLKDHAFNTLPAFWQSYNPLKFDLEFLNYPLLKAQNYLHDLSPCEGWEYITPSSKATLGAAMYALNKSINQPFSTAILEALSLGGDTDSVASIVGAVKGFHVGVASIPPCWQNIVHDRQNFKQDYLMELGRKLFEAKQ